MEVTVDFLRFKDCERKGHFPHRGCVRGLRLQGVGLGVEVGGLKWGLY